MWNWRISFILFAFHRDAMKDASPIMAATDNDCLVFCAGGDSWWLEPRIYLALFENDPFEAVVAWHTTASNSCAVLVVTKCRKDSSRDSVWDEFSGTTWQRVKTKSTRVKTYIDAISKTHDRIKIYFLNARNFLCESVFLIAGFSNLLILWLPSNNRKFLSFKPMHDKIHKYNKIQIQSIVILEKYWEH